MRLPVNGRPQRRQNRVPVAGARQVTIPDPRCPMCEARMEFAEVRWYEKPDHSGSCWHETWGCDSCHTLHTFPARIEMMLYLKATMTVPVTTRTLHLPK